MATIIIPTPLRKFTNNNSRVKLSERTVPDAISQLTTQFPDIKRHLVDTDGKVAHFINIFVDSEDIRNLDLEKTILQENTIVSIVPAVAGGIEFPADYGQNNDRVELIKYTIVRNNT